MTARYFKRAGNIGFNSSQNITKRYFNFLGVTIPLFLLNIINIPFYFGGESHIFLFEAGLFYLIFLQKQKIYFFTILLLYGVMDLLEFGGIGVSFLAFCISFGLFLVLSHLLLKGERVGPRNIFQATILLFLFLLLFVFFKVFLIASLTDFVISATITIFFLKSILYTVFLYLNFSLVFFRGKFFKV